MKSKRKKRRQSHGSAWHWKQTDCWYYTQPGTKKRIALFDDNGDRIRGKSKKREAEIALAKEKLTWSDESGNAINQGPWLVARVCSEYLQYCERSLAKNKMSKGHQLNSVAWLNDLCGYCGALPLSDLKKGHIQEWIDSHESWKSPATHRGVIAVVNAAFNRAEEMFGVVNPIKGLKKPKENPRLASLSPEEEQALYDICEPCFSNFLFAAINTGLRPFSELARLTAEDIEEHDRGMMWRVYASKTDKTRKIPVRPEVAELTRKLMKTAPKGSGKPIFRNTWGKPWKRMNGVLRFINLKKKLKWNEDPVKGKYSCYTCRHTFVHRMLSGYWTEGKGASIETVAELIGDTPTTTFRHYGREWAQNYQDPLWNAIGEGAGTTSQKNGAAKSQRKPRKNMSKSSRQPRPKSKRKTAAAKSK
ncbi:tyrosine-type recombinase/integrase [Gimesia panareensis]|uniref:tyrosine-type recombinase/integrase n=1 Tax=Gimesia panareensis TaxID=2527978 RepID=UPI001189FE28|nr:tyrosine-type recombinase/integrase [Gimesia panareensis]QDU47870.1 Phage integrase family protein [Gimesia panareensis]